MARLDLNAIAGASDEEKRALCRLAIGRILRIASRPFRPGDIEQYEEARAIILAASPTVPGYAGPNYARDRNRGAQGD